MRAAPLAILLAALPGLAVADYYLSEQGICAASDGVLEESDAIWLDTEGMENHFFRCKWEQPVDLSPGAAHFADVSATCGNEVGSWLADFEIVAAGSERMTVFQRVGAPAPLVFYRCAE